jgi:hypothetical protein
MQWFISSWKKGTNFEGMKERMLNNFEGLKGRKNK